MIEFGEPGVLVTFEESIDELASNAAGFGWGFCNLSSEKPYKGLKKAFPTIGQSYVRVRDRENAHYEWQGPGSKRTSNMPGKIQLKS